MLMQFFLKQGVLCEKGELIGLFFFWTLVAALLAIFQTKRLVTIRITATDYFLESLEVVTLGNLYIVGFLVFVFKSVRGAGGSGLSGGVPGYGVPSPPKIKVDHNIHLESVTFDLTKINIQLCSSIL